MDREKLIAQCVAQLEANPYDLQPLGLLEEAWATQQKWEELVAAFAARAPEVASRDAQARLYLEAARLSGTRLRDVERSLELVKQALVVGAETIVSVEARLFQLAFEQDAERLLGFFSEALGDAGNDERLQSRLYLRMGSILEDVMDDADEADNAYTYALELDPANVLALWARQILARKQASWSRLAELIYEEIEQAQARGDGERQADLSVTLGEIYRDYLENPDDAMQCFGYATDIDPNHALALANIQRMQGPPGTQEVDVADVELGPEQGRKTEILVAVKAQAIAAADARPQAPAAPESAPVELAAAPSESSLEESSGEAGEGSARSTRTSQGAKKARRRTPPKGSKSATGPSAAVEPPAVPPAPPAPPAPAAAASPAGTRDSVELELDDVDMLEVVSEPVEAPAAPEVAIESAPDEAVDALVAVESVEVAEVGEPADAAAVEELQLTVPSAAVEEEVPSQAEPSSVPAPQSAAILEPEVAVDAPIASAEETGGPLNWRPMFVAFIAQAEAGGEGALGALVRAARCLARNGAPEADSLRVWELAASQGLAEGLYGACGYLWGEREFWGKVLGRWEALDGSQKPAVVLRARVALYDMGAPDEVRRLMAEGADAALGEVLGDLVEAQENWRKFQRTVELRVAELEPELRNARVYLHMASVAAALGDVDKEIDALRRLERQVDDGHVKNRLKVLYKRSQKWAMYVDLIKQEVEALGEERRADKIDLLFEIIRVYRQEMRHDRMAITVYKEVLTLEPSHGQALDELIALYGEMNMSSDLIHTLQAKAQIVEEIPIKVALYSQIADLFLEKFRNQAEAIKAYESVLELEPHHRQALAFLKDMYEKRRDWEKLIEVSMREIETLPGDSERAQGFKQVAQMAAERLRKPEVAANLWLKVRELAPEDSDALDALEILYEKNRDFEALAQVLSQKASLAGSNDEKNRLLQKLGMLYSERMADVPRAIEAWRSSLALQPDDVKARKALERLYIDHRDWDSLEAFFAGQGSFSELVRLMESLAGTIKDEDVRVELWLRSGRLWRDELGDSARAERSLERVLQLSPGNERAAALLEPIYTANGDGARLRAVLETLLARQTEPAGRRVYQVKLGNLHANVLGQWPQAFEWFSKAVRETGELADMMGELERAAEAASTYEALSALYAERLERLEAEGEEALGRTLRLRLGRLLSEQLGRHEDAIARYEEVLAIEPDEPEALEALDGILRKLERWSDWMSVCTRRLALVEEPQARIAILHGMAAVSETQARAVDAAIGYYEQALALDPAESKTLENLHRLYREVKSHAALAGILERRIELVERAARAPGRPMKLPEPVELSRLVPPSLAAAHMGLGLQTGTQSLFGASADESVSDVLAELGGLSEVSEYLPSLEEDGDGLPLRRSRKVEAPAVPTVVDLSSPAIYLEAEIEDLVAYGFELGELQLRHLGLRNRGLETLTRVVSWRPLHDEALELVEELLGDGELAMRAAAVLGPVYEARGLWAGYMRTLQVQLEEADSDAARLELHVRMARTSLEEMGEGQDAFAHYATAIKLDPSQSDVRSELTRIAAALGLWKELAELYVTLVTDIADAVVRAEFLFELSDVYLDHLEEPQSAQGCYEDLLTLEPTDLRALEALEDVCVRTMQWSELLGVYDRKRELVEDPEQRRALRLQAAWVWEHELGNLEEAMLIHRELSQEYPEDVALIARLGELYHALGQWQELAGALEQQLALVPDAERAAVQTALADVLYSQNGDHARALDLYEAVLTEDPAHLGAREALEAIMRAEGPSRTRASQILEGIYREQSEWTLLIEALEVQFATCDHLDERVALLHRIGQLHEEFLEDSAKALDVYARALVDDPQGQGGTFEQLYRVADAADLHAGLVTVFEAAVSEQTDEAVRRDLMMRAAQLYTEKLGDLERAAERLQDVLAILATDGEALLELENLYRQMQAWPSLVGVLTRRAELVEETSERIDLLRQAAHLQEELLEQPEEAVGLYEAILALDEADRPAIERLEALLTTLERWEDVVDVYGRMLDLSEDAAERTNLLYLMGAIQQEQLADSAAAIDTYRRVLENDAAQEHALVQLDALYGATEQWHELLSTLEARLALGPEAEEGRELRLRMGRLWEGELDDATRALEIYRGLVEDAPEQVDSIAALEGMIARGVLAAEAAEILAPVYETGGRWERLAEVYRLKIAATHDVLEGVQLFAQLVALHEEQLDDAPAALDVCLDALAYAPHQSLFLEDIERLAAQLERWERVLARLDEVIAEVTDPEVVLALELRIARWQQEHLADFPAAIERYRRALAIERGCEEAIEALARLLQAEERWDELAEVLQMQIVQATERPEIEALRLRLGYLQSSRLGDVASAVEQYQAVLLDDPANTDAVDALERLFEAGQRPEALLEILVQHYVGEGAYEKLVAMYRARLEDLEPGEERHAMFVQIGRLQMDQLDASQEALHSYGQALLERPEDEATLEELEQLAATTGQWADAAGHILEALESPFNSDESILRLLGRLAWILEYELGELDAAEDTYLKVLAAEPGQDAALLALDHIYAGQERHVELAGILTQRVAGASDEEVRLGLQSRLAHLYHEQLGELEQAVETSLAILAVEPEHIDSLEMLQDIYQSREQWPELYDVLDRRAQSALDPEEQAAFLSAMAHIAEGPLARPADAVELWNRVVAMIPDSVEALAELGRLYRELGQWSELVQSLERALDLTYDDAERRGLLEELATLWATELDNADQATDSWLRLLEVDGEYLPALEAVRDASARQGDYSRLGQMLERMIAHPQVGPERRLALWMELGDVRTEMLLDVQGAIEAWREVLEIDDSNAVAIDNLERLYIQENLWDEAVEILILKAEFCGGAQSQVTLWLQIAQIFEQQLFDRERAAFHFHKVLEAQPDNHEASQALEAIYQDSEGDEASQALANLYIDRASVQEDDASARVQALRQAAEVFEQRLGAPESALVVLLSALASETAGDGGLVAEIERLARDTQNWSDPVERIAEVLGELGDSPLVAGLEAIMGRWFAVELGQHEDAIYYLERSLAREPDNRDVLVLIEEQYAAVQAWQELAEILRRRVALAEEPEERIELWRRLGELMEQNIGDLDGAIASYGQILALDPSDAWALEALERVYELSEYWPELVAVLERKLQSSFDPEELLATRMRMAGIFERHLGDLDQARHCYQQVLAAEPTHLPALDALEQLYREAGQWVEVLEVYEQRLGLVNSAQEQVDLYFEMARIYEQEFADTGRALECLQNVVALEPANAKAIKKVTRLLTLEERWYDLVEALRGFAEVVERAQDRVVVYNEIGRVLRDNLQDLEGSIEAYRQSLQIEPNQVEIWYDIAYQHEYANAWAQALECYERVLPLLEDANTQVEVYSRQGQILETYLQDDDGAEKAYQLALRVIPGHAVTVESLQYLYERREDWQGLIRLHRHAEDVTFDLAQKSAHQAAIGRVYEQHLRDQISALRYYESALELDPQNHKAIMPVVEIYFAEGRHERTVPLLKTLLDGLRGGQDVEEWHYRQLQLGRAYLTLKQEAPALEAFRLAFELDPHDPETLRGFGQLLYEAGEFEQAQRVLEALEREHLSTLGDEELVSLYVRLGHIKRRAGELRAAVSHYDRAVQIDGANREALEALVATSEEQGRWEQVVHYLRMLLPVRTDDAWRLAQLTRLGDICNTRLERREEAVEAYTEALAIEPRSVSLLRKLLDLYTKTQQWVESVQILLRLIEQEEKADRRAKYFYTAAVIYRDEIRDVAQAVALFDKALDVEISMLKAFEAIDRILTEARAWKDLERAYRRMLRRITDNDDGSMEGIKALLWQNLGEIYRSRLGHAQSAIQAYEAAVAISPENTQLRLILADLYDRAGDNPDGAIEQHKELIRLDAFRIDSYRALFRAYIQKRDFDKAWCMAGALNFLQSATDQEQKFYAKYLVASLPVARSTVNQEMLALLVHSQQDPLVTFILRLLAQCVSEAYALDPKELGLNRKKDLLDLDQPVLFCRVFTHVSRTMGMVPAPPVFLKADQALGIRNANLFPPSILIGGDMRQLSHDRQLAFHTGKTLCWMMPQHYLGSLGHPTEFLKILFMTAMDLTNPSLGVGQTLGQAGAEVSKLLRECPPQLLMSLQKAMLQYLQLGRNPNLSEWMTATEHTAIRAGLLMCGDLQVAASCIKNDLNPLGKATPKEKIREMVLFSISDEYFALRAQLGLSIGG